MLDVRAGPAECAYMIGTTRAWHVKKNCFPISIAPCSGLATQGWYGAGKGTEKGTSIGSYQLSEPLFSTIFLVFLLHKATLSNRVVINILPDVACILQHFAV